MDHPKHAKLNKLKRTFAILDVYCTEGTLKRQFYHIALLPYNCALDDLYNEMNPRRLLLLADFIKKEFVDLPLTKRGQVRS